MMMQRLLQKNTRKKKRLTFVHAFNDEYVIAGQGTIGIEIFEELPSVDAVIVPIGGGGLIGGIALALKTLKPNSRNHWCRSRRRTIHETLVRTTEDSAPEKHYDHRRWDSSKNTKGPNVCSRSAIC